MRPAERRARGWRRGRTRGVSEILATILLVAIGIVLAAVLYVLVVGVAHGPGNTPIGSAFAAGDPRSSNGVGSAGSSTCALSTTTLAPAVKSGDWSYTLDVETSTASLGSLLLQVRTATGAFDTALIGFYTVNLAGLVVACAGSSAMPASGSMSQSLQFVYPTAGGARSSTLPTAGYQIVLEMGSIDPTGQGYRFGVAGQGAYSGTTAAVTLP
jgi:flagellin-like protein